MKRYRTRPGKQLKVLGQLVTDAEAGVPLPDTPGVREHVALRRLVPVGTAKLVQDETPTKPIRRRRKESKE